MKRCCCSKRMRRKLRQRLRGISPRRTWLAWIWTKRDGTESKPVSSKKQVPKHAINSAREIKKERKKAQRIANLEKEKSAPKVSSNVPATPGLRIEEDPDAMRIKLLFDGKPEPDVIAKLKKHGFHWSPTNKAWQRQLNNAGRYAAQTVVSFAKSVSGTA